VGQIFLCKPPPTGHALRPSLFICQWSIHTFYRRFGGITPPTDAAIHRIHLTPLCELLSICARRGHKEAILERVYRHWHCICIRGGQLKAPSRPAESASIELYNHMVRMVKWEKERAKWGSRNERGIP